MSANLTIKVHSVVNDGLPDMDKLTGCVGFIHDGAIFSGWPLDCKPGADQYWESPKHGQFYGVNYWLEFPIPVYSITLEPKT